MKSALIKNIPTLKKFDGKTFKHTLTDKKIIKLLKYNDNNVPEPVIDSISNSLNKIENYSSFVGGYKIFDVNQVEIEKDKIIVDKHILNTQKIISFGLKKSETISIIVGTIGETISEYLTELMENGDSLEAYIADLIASEMVENWIDSIEGELKKYCSQFGMKTTNRYSPGYCGWDVGDQHKLFSLLPDSFCGIKLTDSSLMLPIKSVSAIVGIGMNVEKVDYQCSICDTDFCYKRIENE
jgi:hypothetical protein